MYRSSFGGDDGAVDTPTGVERGVMELWDQGGTAAATTTQDIFKEGHYWNWFTSEGMIRCH